MSMDPTEYHEIFGITVIEKVRLVDGVASIRCAFLIGNDELGNKKRIRDECAA